MLANKPSAASHMTFRHLLVFFLALLDGAHLPLQAQQTRSSDGIAVAVNRGHKDGLSYFNVHAAGFSPATPQQTWRVMTDYARLPEFVPNLSSTRVIARKGNEVVIEQNGTAGFWFIQRKVRLVARIIEQPISAVDLTFVDGDMKLYTARWELAPSMQNGMGGTLITYTATMEPDFFVPPLVGQLVVQTDVRRTMAAIIAEVGRRALE
jgi:ribosome-associated toxin RatA of RatAB toxin-antitoxin module